MNAFKLSPEAPGPAGTGRRQALPPAAPPRVAHPRPHPANLPPSAARQQIAIQIEEPSEAPRVVKIIHLDSI